VNNGKSDLVVINLNDTIEVRLTKHGLDVHRAEYDELDRHYGGELPFAYVPPKMDTGGWSSFQLHQFMNTFGTAMDIGSENVIEGNNIRYWTHKPGSIALAETDKEIAALKECHALLSRLSRFGQERVIEYIRAKLRDTEDVTPPQTTQEASK
jgi:hypothetical protein